MKSYSGINIQFPISQLIISGKKTIETRTYPIPEKYKNIDLVIIETPGKAGKFKARMIGFIKFGNCFQYPSPSAFYKDTKKHCVTKDSPWAWNDSQQKWGWTVLAVKPFKKPLPLQKPSGIKYSTNIQL